MINIVSNKHRLIFSRTIAYTITSPIDTIRLNLLVNRNITKKKLINGFTYATGMTVTLSNVCYSMVNENNNNALRSILTGVFLMNFISTPLIYNYKRVLTGHPMKLIDLNKSKALFALSMFDDFVEEGLKFYLSKYHINNPGRNKFIDSILIILFTYPTDIIKNRITYDKNLEVPKYDLFIRIFHKMFQSYIFFKMLMLV